MNITSHYLLTLIYSAFRLGDRNGRRGFVEFQLFENVTEFSRLKISNDSKLLCEENLKYICRRSGFRGYPLYKLTRRADSSENVYEVDNCAPCYDFYLECNDFPFRIDPSGDVRLFFESMWTGFCQDPPMSLEEASKFCLRNAKANGDVSLIPGSLGQYNQSWIIRRPASSSISSCDTLEFQSNACHPGNLMAIRCAGLPKQRLISDDKDDHSGRVEVRVIRDDWVPLSAERLTLNDAKVLCRSLGYPSDNSNYKKRKSEASQMCKTGPLLCQGNEKTLVDCPGYSESVTGSCSYFAEISCSNASEGDLRLAGGFDNLSGRLEIYHLNKWGTVCDKNFGETEIRVACRQITQGKVTKGQKIYYTSTSPVSRLSDILLDSVDCEWDDNNLGECTRGQWERRSCMWYDGVVYLSCAETPKFRLYGGENRYVGRLEVFHDNQWGTICNKNFGSNEARTACMSLGMPSIMAHVVSGRASPSVARIWLDGLDCTSEMDNLTDCGGWEWGVIRDSCSHRYDVEISCKNIDPSSLNYRLVGGGAGNIGVLEIAYNNQWGTVCAGSSSNAKAQVVCRSLGLPWSNALMFDTNAFSFDSSKIWMSISSCRGSEESLLQCSSFRFGSTANSCFSSERLAVSCGTASPSDYSVRLVNHKTNKNAGRLEVQINGIWGTVCSERVSSGVARVVCRQLGLSTEHARKVNIDSYDSGTGIIWLNEIYCSGSEQNLIKCPTKDIGQGSCYHAQDLAIRCDEPDSGSGEEGEDESEGGYPGRSALIAGVTSALIVATIIMFAPIICIVVQRRRNAAKSRRDLQTGLASPDERRPWTISGDRNRERLYIPVHRQRDLSAHGPTNRPSRSTNTFRPSGTSANSTGPVSNTTMASQETLPDPPPSRAVLKETLPPPSYAELFPDRRTTPGFDECSV